MAPQLRRREVFMAGKEARISPQLCSACGECAKLCRFDAIHLVQTESGRSVYSVDPMSCEGCGLCARVCSSAAVSMVDAERGEWFVSDTRHGPLVHARLNIGGENSGKLVTLARTQAVALGEEMGVGLGTRGRPTRHRLPGHRLGHRGGSGVGGRNRPSPGAHDLDRAGDGAGLRPAPWRCASTRPTSTGRWRLDIEEVCAASGPSRGG